MSSSVAIVIPSYNEGAGLKVAIEQWLKVCKELPNTSYIVLVDDGSVDNSVDDLIKSSLNLECLVVVSQSNQGHGAALRVGYSKALDLNVDYVFQADADSQVPIVEFWKLWQRREDREIVVGVRRNRQDGTDRKSLSWVLRFHIRGLTGQSLLDANCPFRLITRGFLQAYLKALDLEPYLINVLMLIFAKSRAEKIEWVDVSFGRRTLGDSHLNLKRLWPLYPVVVKELVRARGFFNHTD